MFGDLALAIRRESEAQALAWYGLLRDETGGLLLRFVEGRPVSQVTENCVTWVCQRLRTAGKKALLLIRDNAPWHVGQRVWHWIKGHNRQATVEGGVRILPASCHARVPSCSEHRLGTT